MCPTFLFLILKEIFGSWKEREVGWGLSDPGKRDETCLLSERQQKQEAARGTEAGFPDRLAWAHGWRPPNYHGKQGRRGKGHWTFCLDHIC